MNSPKIHNLIESFSSESLIDFFREKTSSFTPKRDQISSDNPDFINGQQVGVFTTDNENFGRDNVAVFSFKTGRPLNERSGKKAQYEVAKKILKNNSGYTAGIFVFYDGKGDFRFSLVYDIITDTAKRQWSNFRRFTYFVSREQTNKTFIRQISEAEFTSLSKIIEAFSIEPVTKQFYNEIQNWYFWALQKVRFPEDAENQPNGREINLIRFITRIIFIYFMKEKKWISNNLFQQNELIEILINLNPEESTYYKAILQNLFFAVLNTPIKERKFRREDNYKGRNDDYMNHTYFRYHKLFKNENDIIEIFQNIPFLNGGLFECLDKRKDDPDNNTGKEIRIDGFSDVESKQPIFPNELFFADEQEFILQNEVGNDKKNTKVNVRGIINILNSYNFTTEENSLSDTEIALDPELLGKVFENLLAAYNPETATTARKATGSYYTPREIVDFMVNESLKVYFQSSYVREFGNQSLRDFENKLEILFSLEDDENPFDKKITQFLIEKIHKVKILDPAVGSGAFPMGCLHKLVFLLSKLDPHNNSWKNEQLRTVEMITDPDLRQKVKNKIEESFKKNELDYGRKLYLIQNCIYGVDIQPIAVQITKLRFFISLLVDEKINNTSPEENFGIDPLPNLETKLIAANTLINLPVEPYTCPRMNEIIELEKKIFELRKNHFSTSSSDDKAKIQKQDFEYRKKLIQIIEMYVKENQDKLQKLQNELLKYPPKIETVSKQTLLGSESVKVDVNKEKREYIQKKINETKKYVEADKLLTQKFIKIASFNIYNSNFPTDWFDPEWMFGVTDGFDIVIGNPPYVSTKGVSEKDKKVLQQQFGFADDLYNHFYFKGIQLLKEKGILAYISSKTFWTIQTKKNLRELILKNKLLQLVDTANPFESAMVDTCITIVQKENASDYDIKFIDLRNGWDNKKEYSVKDSVYKNVVNNVFFEPNEINMKIYEKIAKKLNPLIKNWWSLISTSKNIEKYKTELENYRQSLKPGDITLLGLITEGGQGLATANNGKYIGVLEGTKWADKVRQDRVQKLWEFIQNQKPKELIHLKSKTDVQLYLNQLSEKEIRNLFDDLKENYGRDIFGQGSLYRIVNANEIADVEKLTQDEKLNGISGTKTFVPYDKGDKDGNRWWAPTPYYIDWSRENVKFLKENSGKKGEGMPVVRNPQFYFREGFCWSDIHTKFIKCRIKESGIHDVKSMSLFSLNVSNFPDFYFVTILNSTFISEYVEAFIKNTQTFQINDARQLPIIIPTQEQLKEFEAIFDRAMAIQKQKFLGTISENKAQALLDEIQRELDEKVMELYGVKE